MKKDMNSRLDIVITTTHRVYSILGVLFSNFWSLNRQGHLLSLKAPKRILKILSYRLIWAVGSKILLLGVLMDVQELTALKICI